MARQVGVGRVDDLHRLAPAAAHVKADAVGAPAEGELLGAAALLDEALDEGVHVALVGGYGAAARGEVTSVVEDRGAHGPGAVSGADRLDELARLQARGKDDVDGGEAERSHVHRVDARAVGGGHLVGVALLELKDERLQVGLGRDQRGHDLLQRAGDVDPRAGEDAAKHRPALVDATRGEELGRGGALERGASAGLGGFGGRDVRPACLLVPPGPAEHLGEARVQRAARSTVPGRVDRQLVEARGLIERQERRLRARRP